MPFNRLHHDLPKVTAVTYRLPQFSAVRFPRNMTGDSVAIPAGTSGIIVDVYDDGYGVEIRTPAEDVVIVNDSDIGPA